MLAAPLIGDAVGLKVGCVVAPSFADGAPSFADGAPSFADVNKEAKRLMVKSRGEVTLGSAAPSDQVLAMSKFSSVAISAEFRTSSA